VGRFALRLGVLALTLFHGQLLWRRWADGSLGDGAVVARWLAAALLVVGLFQVQRRRGGLFRGREAAVLWVLVALLHALAGVPAHEMLAAPAPWLAVPLGLVIARTIALALGLRDRLLPAAEPRRGSAPFLASTPTPGLLSVAAGRAPPA
jgi:hypothetical protein